VQGVSSAECTAKMNLPRIAESSAAGKGKHRKGYEKEGA
jgi:hypothetical protein